MKSGMKTLPIILAAALLVLPFACKSAPEAPVPPCTCGTPAADIEGCAHPSCLAGETNHDNPHCVCGTLSIPK